MQADFEACRGGADGRSVSSAKGARLSSRWSLGVYVITMAVRGIRGFDLFVVGAYFNILQ